MRSRLGYRPFLSEHLVPEGFGSDELALPNVASCRTSKRDGEDDGRNLVWGIDVEAPEDCFRATVSGAWRAESELRVHELYLVRLRPL